MPTGSRDAYPNNSSIRQGLTAHYVARHAGVWDTSNDVVDGNEYQLDGVASEFHALERLLAADCSVASPRPMNPMMENPMAQATAIFLNSCGNATIAAQMTSPKQLTGLVLLSFASGLVQRWMRRRESIPNLQHLETVCLADTNFVPDSHQHDVRTGLESCRGATRVTVKAKQPAPDHWISRWLDGTLHAVAFISGASQNITMIMTTHSAGSGL